MQLSYGTINWLTKGLFLGYRKVWINPQIDDLLIDSDMWDIAALTDTTGLLFRLSGDDFLKAIAWQNSVRTKYPLASSLTLEWAYNGEGASGIYSQRYVDPGRAAESECIHVRQPHVHAHEPGRSRPRIKRCSPSCGRITRGPINLGFTRYFTDTMVQPDISGLYNTAFFRAAKDFGIKYMISDTSRPGWNNPTPNAGYLPSLPAGHSGHPASADQPVL